ncbi:hypothetical protein CBS101457_003037 [Exobasidium rhododendri]|nr:hypothetical protein CBS101457_003037 [Exobasidium rhododendri]
MSSLFTRMVWVTLVYVFSVTVYGTPVPAPVPVPMEGDWGFFNQGLGRVNTRSRDNSTQRSGISDAQTARLPTHQVSSAYPSYVPPYIPFERMPPFETMDGSLSSRTTDYVPNFHYSHNNYRESEPHPSPFGVDAYHQQADHYYGQNGGGHFGDPLPHQFVLDDDNTEGHNHSLDDSSHLHSDHSDRYQVLGEGSSSGYVPNTQTSYPFHPAEIDNLSLYDDNSDQLHGDAAAILPSYNIPVQGEEHNENQYDDVTLIWNNLDQHTHHMIDEVISKRRGLRYDSARKCIRPRLTHYKMMLLLSGERDKVDKALTLLIRHSKKTILPLWMDILDDAQCDALVQKLSLLTGKSAELVRNYFLNSRLDSSTAYDLLFRASDADLVQWAETHGLTLPNYRMKEDGHKKRHPEAIPSHPYKIGLTTSECTQLMKLLSDAYGMSSFLAYGRLKHKRIPPSFGQQILLSTGQYRASLINYLKKGQYLPVTDGTDQ